MAKQIGLDNARILVPRRDTLLKLVTFVPQDKADAVTSALHKAGAGNIGHYRNCSFKVIGTGSFLPDQESNPTIGQRGKLSQVEEVRIEVIVPAHFEKAVIQAMRTSHPYEEVSYYLSKLENENSEVGAGMPAERP